MTDAGIRRLTALRRLKRIRLLRSSVTPAGRAALPAAPPAALPGVQIDPNTPSDWRRLNGKRCRGASAAVI